MSSRYHYFRQYKARQRYTAKGRTTGQCTRCGSKEKLEFAHLEKCNHGEGRGSISRIRAVVRNPACYVLLCSGCHADYDRE